MPEFMNSTLAPELIACLHAVDACLAAGVDVSEAYAPAPALLAKISPLALAKAESDIVHAAALHWWRAHPTLLQRLSFRHHNEAAQLQQVPRLEHLFLFHRNGRLREAALDKLDGPVDSPFLFVALAWRLNDWAVPVRQAAVRCVERCYPLTAPNIAAQGLVALLRYSSSWRRWTVERDLVYHTLARPDVAQAFAAALIAATSGPNASILARALRVPSLDASLRDIAHNARQPATRAVALAALFAGAARWQVGRQWQWINKSIGRGRNVPSFASRPLALAPDLPGLIRQALADRAALCRSIAMSALIRHRSIIPDASDLARSMLADPARRVRERAQFLLQERARVG